MDLSFEVVSIPYENGASLPGYFLKADASNKPRPTLMSLGGGDSLAEELYFWAGARRRFAGDTTHCCSRFQGSVVRYIRIPVPTCSIGQTPKFH